MKMAPKRGHFLLQKNLRQRSLLLVRGDLGRRRLEHQAAVDMADHNGEGHKHHRSGHSAEDEADES